ncbi:hypothetical protein L1987_32469 [Smallanthus sonchifolius]|uniref:Uncharacterized protein n=2 Tax=Smallanthus sonchifolius TaxID=185202 RepID=A0ACB9HMS9_9ASTR|nr:hypothetical protein L1987_32467 [Smallanthus sonchifolius]KAI3797214.1 hypothetical protein L1987_32469 [Smallanthus sonchifolius]
MGNLNQKPQQYSHPDDHGEDQQHKAFTCEICIEPVTIPNNKFKNSNKCVHPFCTDCIIKYIQVKLEDNVSDIKCPATTCNHSLEPLSCRTKITHQLFDKWCDALCESKVLRVDRLYCPNRECLELILNECGDRSLKRCVSPDCKKPFCYTCKVPWHASSTCEERRDENDVAFDVLYETNKWRKCPRCGHCIEHVSGCSTIRCRCGINFCYKSGKDKCNHGLWEHAAIGYLVDLLHHIDSRSAAESVDPLACVTATAKNPEHPREIQTQIIHALVSTSSFVLLSSGSTADDNVARATGCCRRCSTKKNHCRVRLLGSL